MKVVINRCFGGYGLSDEVLELYAAEKGINIIKNSDNKLYSEWYIDGIKDEAHYFSQHSLYDKEYRCDPVLVSIVEKLGDKANGSYSELKIVEIPDNIEWYILEQDGLEWVAEKHRTWS